MNRLLGCLLVCAVVVVAQFARGDVPAKETERAPAKEDSPEAALPVGKWNVKFANGVQQACEIVALNGGQATVAEPQRTSRGRVVVKGEAFVLTFGDDRVERWTAGGRRFVVEHWFPSSGFPTATPVLGLADRTP